MKTIIQLTEQDLINVIKKISNDMKYEYHNKNLGKKKLFEQKKPVTPVTPAQPTQVQLDLAKTKINNLALKEATTIYNQIKSSFDMDGDGDFTDWDGTNETNALAAIKKITSKETLNLINNMIAKQGQFNSLKSWINSEMSDFDSEYGSIWEKLESLGYSGQNKNILYKLAGYTPIGLIAKGVDKGIDYLRSLSLEDIMEGFRGIVSGVAGTVAQIIISFTGPIGAGIILAINGVLLAWDIYQLSSGSAKFSWFNLIMDLLGTTMAGASLKAALKPAQLVLQAEKTLPGFFGKMAQKFPTIFEFFKKVGSIIGGAAKFVVNLFQKGFAFIIKYIPFLKTMLAPIEKGLGKLGGLIGDILNSLKGAGGKLATTIGSKITGVSARIASSKAGPTLAAVLNKTKTLGIKFLESKFGVGALKTTDQFAMNRVEEFIKDKGYHLPISGAQIAMCEVGPKECVAMKAIAQAAG